MALNVLASEPVHKRNTSKESISLFLKVYVRSRCDHTLSNKYRNTFLPQFPEYWYL